jgi:cytochrome c
MTVIRCGTATLIALMIFAVDAAAVEQGERRGKAVLQQFCSRCHALGTRDKSPYPNAPAFRMLGNSYDLDSFAGLLREGVSSVHPDMPSVTFSREDAEAAASYIRSIQK